MELPALKTNELAALILFFYFALIKQGAYGALWLRISPDCSVGQWIPGYYCIFEDGVGQVRIPKVSPSEIGVV